MQDDLFGPPPSPAPAPGLKHASGPVVPAPADAALVALAAALPPQLRLGTSSWAYPDWNGLVWDGDYPDAMLSKQGLAAYAQHPLLLCVRIDQMRGKPRPSQLAAQQLGGEAA